MPNPSPPSPRSPVPLSPVPQSPGNAARTARFQPPPYVWLLILAIAFACRFAAAVYWHRAAEASDSLFRLGDSHSYWTLAGHIARGEAYQYGSPDASIFRAPVYPILLAPFTLLNESSNAVFYARCMGCFLGTLAVWLLGRLAARCVDERTAVFVGIIAAIYPSAIGMSITILSEAVFMPLMVGHLLLWRLASKSDKPMRLALAMGVVAGTAILARPSWLLFTPFAIVAAATVLPNKGLQLKILFTSALAIAVTMSPWWVRNSMVTGKFVPTTLQVGPSLMDGWHEQATGSSDTGMTFMREIIAEQIKADQQSNKNELEGTLEWRINQAAIQKATQWAADNKLRVVQLGFHKFLRTWSIWPDGGEAGSFAMRLAISVSTFTVLIASLLGTLLCWQSTRPANKNDATRQVLALAAPSPAWVGWVTWLPCLYFTTLHMVFVGSVRYREPAVFILILLAGVAIRHCSPFSRRAS